MPVPYEVTCECGEVLIITERRLDKDHDLMVKVESCETCADKAYDQGKADTKEAG